MGRCRRRSVRPDQPLAPLTSHAGCRDKARPTEDDRVMTEGHALIWKAAATVRSRGRHNGPLSARAAISWIIVLSLGGWTILALAFKLL